ncbi:MAG: hypothetical protein ABSF61_13240 [Anaerolineales bacterium]|jgi:hypothetical protein
MRLALPLVPLSPSGSFWQRAIRRVRLATQLEAMGITHLMYSRDEEFRLEEPDPTGPQRRAEDYFFDEFVPACARVRFAGGWAPLYEITCGPG